MLVGWPYPVDCYTRVLTILVAHTPKTCGILILPAQWMTFWHLAGFLYIAITEIACGLVQEALSLSGRYLEVLFFSCFALNAHVPMMTFHAFVVCFDQDWLKLLDLVWNFHEFPMTWIPCSPPITNLCELDLFVFQILFWRAEEQSGLAIPLYLQSIASICI